MGFYGFSMGFYGFSAYSVVPPAFSEK